MATPIASKVSTMAEAAAAAHGVVLVVARFTGGTEVRGGRSTLQVLLETPSGESPDVEVCAKVSRLLAAQLDVAEVIAGKYTLEVSSPGLDRPLMSATDCARFVGQGAAFKFRNPQEFKGKPLGAAKGTLTATSGDEITLEIDGTLLTFNFHTVQNAELAPTAAEMAAFMGFSSKPVRGTPHPLSVRAAKAKAVVARSKRDDA